MYGYRIWLSACVRVRRKDPRCADIKYGCQHEHMSLTDGSLVYGYRIWLSACAHVSNGKDPWCTDIEYGCQHAHISVTERIPGVRRSNQVVSMCTCQ